MALAARADSALNTGPVLRRACFGSVTERRYARGMRVGLFVMAVVWLTGCGGRVQGEPPVGACMLVDGNWVCTMSKGDAGGSAARVSGGDTGSATGSIGAMGTDAGEPSTLPQCQSNVVAGSSCQDDESVSTTNTTRPANVTGPAPNCFDCSGGGTGTEWTCGSGGWEAAATYSCQ